MTSVLETRKAQFKVGGMMCSFCTTTIEKALGGMPGVRKVNVQLAHEETLVEYEPSKVSPGELREVLESLGYRVRDPKKVRSFEEESAELQREKDRLVGAAALTWMALVLMALMWLGRHLPWTHWLMAALALLAVFGPGRYILKMALASLRRLILNQHVLLELAAFAGLAGGGLGLLDPRFPAPDFFAVTVFVTTYHILSGYASLLVRTRSSQAVKKLLALQPPTARVIRNGQEEEVPIEEVRVGDRVRIRPGEKVPVDGQVAAGASAVDESLVTGEPIPKEKLPGDEVIGGSLNQFGTLVVEVTRIGEESFLQQVARHVEEARALKPGIMLLVDLILKFYVPSVLVVAGAAVLLWTLGVWAFWGEVEGTRAIFAALAVLVMGYPCALGMATPLAMIRGGGLAALRGILIRAGSVFQVFKDVKKVVLDKTGTLTRGKPRVVEVFALGSTTVEEVLSLAASAEAPSEHPLARAIVEEANENGIAFEEAEEFQAVAGRGVEALVGGRKVRVGSLRFLEGEGIDLKGSLSEAERLQAKGRTLVAVSAEGELAGLLAISDVLKEDAAEAIREMKEAGLHPVMLTGDNARTARAIAEEVGIEEVMAEVLPAGKAEEVRKLQGQGYRVAMVGDGINDAPALMQADVGIAIGAGTDIAMESADVILVGDRLGPALEAYYIARASYRKTVQNLSLAFSFNAVGVPLAATGLVHPIWAMAAMVASVSTVLLNSFGGRLIPRVRPRRMGEGEERHLSFHVPTIHCEGCVRTIQDALKTLPTVVSVEGDLKAKRVHLTVQDGDLTSQDIAGAIERAGHVVAQE